MKKNTKKINVERGEQQTRGFLLINCTKEALLCAMLYEKIYRNLCKKV